MHFESAEKSQARGRLCEAKDKLQDNLDNWFLTENMMISVNPPENLSVEEYIYNYQNGGWFMRPGVIQENARKLKERSTS